MISAWISQSLVDKLCCEANDKFPLETGGILMGYFSQQEVVITAIAGPGQNAIHKQNAFAPDYVFHQKEVARLYAASGQRWIYLGDWHSHPKQRIPSLSAKDLQTLRRIAKSRPAR